MIQTERFALANLYNGLFTKIKIIFAFFQKTLAFFSELWYNSKCSMELFHKVNVRQAHYREVSIWQSAVFAERELFSDSPFHTHIAKQTEHGNPISAR